MGYRTILRSVLAAAALVAVSGFAGSARAEYVCSTSFNPGSSPWGTTGNVTAILSTTPHCGGTLSQSRIFCSPGATHNTCPSVASALYDRPALIAVLEALRAAAQSQQRVGLTLVTCIGGGQNCAGYLTFYAD